MSDLFVQDVFVTTGETKKETKDKHTPEKI